MPSSWASTELEESREGGTGGRGLLASGEGGPDVIIIIIIIIE
jgi:hypothetical protein